VLFWAVTIAMASAFVLFAGSQIAHDRGQTVDWYTGFGQWLGALGSFVAAGAALWISMSDRRHNVEERQRTEDQQNADLERQAGLVQVTAERLGQRQAAGPNIVRASVGIRNRRSDRIFDIEVVKFVHNGRETDLEVEIVNGFAVSPVRPEHRNSFPKRADLPGIALATDEKLVIYQQGSIPDTQAEYVAVRYTDPAGRRWEVDTEGVVVRR
jgi:hypothetical protein